MRQISISKYEGLIIMRYFFVCLCLFILLFAGNLFSQNITINDSPTLNDHESKATFYKDSSAIFNDSGFIITAADGNSYLRIYSSIRLNGAYDIGGLQSQQNFSTYDIPTSGEN